MNPGYINAIHKAYQNIDYVNRFEKILTHTDFQNRLRKIDRNKTLQALRELGYVFKVRTPGPEFILEEIVSELKFKFSLDIKGGIILSFIYVYLNDEKIEFPHPNMVFTYKYLLNDLDKLMNPSTVFVDHEEFKIIVKDLLILYEDLKVEFFNELKARGLPY